MKLQRDWKPERKIKQFAKRHGLMAVVMRPPLEAPFIRVWFDMDNSKHVELEARARRLYGDTRGGWTA